MRKIGLLVVAAVVVAAVDSAAACSGPTVLFEDHFASYDPTWGTHGDELTIEQGRMVLRPQADRVDWQTNDRARYADVEVCAAVTILDSVTPDEVQAGLLFWYVDDNNFYAFEVDTSGHAAIWQMANGEWHAPVPWASTDLVPIGDSNTDRLQVVTKGTTATTYVNDQPFADVTADAVIAGGQKVGIIAGSPMAGVATNAFADFVVTAPN